jgi:hypothetical protein
MINLKILEMAGTVARLEPINQDTIDRALIMKEFSLKESP